MPSTRGSDSALKRRFTLDDGEQREQQGVTCRYCKAAAPVTSAGLCERCHGVRERLNDIKRAQQEETWARTMEFSDSTMRLNRRRNQRASILNYYKQLFHQMYVVVYCICRYAWIVRPALTSVCFFMLRWQPGWYYHRLFATFGCVFASDAVFVPHIVFPWLHENRIKEMAKEIETTSQSQGGGGAGGGGAGELGGSGGGDAVAVKEREQEQEQFWYLNEKLNKEVSFWVGMCLFFALFRPHRQLFHHMMAAFVFEADSTDSFYPLVVFLICRFKQSYHDYVRLHIKNLWSFAPLSALPCMALFFWQLFTVKYGADLYQGNAPPPSIANRAFALSRLYILNLVVMLLGNTTAVLLKKGRAGYISGQGV